jgi:hypothetical protein
VLAKRLFKLVVATCLTVVGVPVSSSASAFDLAADFSIVANPNGAWSYGWSTTLGGAFTLDTTAVTEPTTGMERWLGVAPDGTPFVEYNPTAAPQSFGTGLLAPGEAAFDPGPAGEFAVVRWTAPAAGDYSLSVSFSGRDTVAGDTDVHVLRNGVSLSSDGVVGFGDTVVFATLLTGLGNGDRIDFLVGWGSDATHFFDTTGIDAVISSDFVPVPEPATPGLGALGLAASAQRGRWGQRRF